MKDHVACERSTCREYYCPVGNIHMAAGDLTRARAMFVLSFLKIANLRPEEQRLLQPDLTPNIEWATAANQPPSQPLDGPERVMDSFWAPLLRSQGTES
jgi:hypothetical protein